MCTSTLFAMKLGRLSTPAEYVRKFAEACVIPIILYCSPAIFPGLLKQDFALPRRSIKIISNVCDLSFSYLTYLVCERHIKASSDFAERILADSEHEELSKARSHTSTRSRFKLHPSKTAAYRNSVLPALSRLLVDRNAELNYYIQELSWSISTSFLSPLSWLYNFSKLKWFYFPICTTSLVATTWSLSKKRLRIYSRSKIKHLLIYIKNNRMNRGPTFSSLHSFRRRLTSVSGMCLQWIAPLQCLPLSGSQTR